MDRFFIELMSHLSHVKQMYKSTNTSHTFLNTTHKRKGTFLTEIPQQRVLAGTEFRTCDLLNQIFFDLQPYFPNRKKVFNVCL